MVCTSGPNDPPRPDTWAAGWTGSPSPDDAPAPGQVYLLADPAL
jgi:hypothetical protein